jgi:hypothetical protein
VTAAIFIVAVLGALLALLAVPVDVAFRLEGIEPLKGQVTIRWLLGAVVLRVPVPRAGKAGEAVQGAKTPVKARAKPRKRRGRGNIFAVLRQADFRRRLWRLLNDFVAAAQFRELRLRLRLGLDDPADTGRLWALLGPLAAAAQNLRNAEVRIEPEFIDAALEFHAAGQLRLIPLQYVTLAIGFVLSPVSIRAWRTLASSHA